MNADKPVSPLSESEPHPPLWISYIVITLLCLLIVANMVFIGIFLYLFLIYKPEAQAAATILGALGVFLALFLKKLDKHVEFRYRLVHPLKQEPANTDDLEKVQGHIVLTKDQDTNWIKSLLAFLTEAKK